MHQCRYHPRPLRLPHLVLGCCHVGTFITLLGLDFPYWIIPSHRSLARLFCSDTLYSSKCQINVVKWFRIILSTVVNLCSVLGWLLTGFRYSFLEGSLRLTCIGCTGTNSCLKDVIVFKSKVVAVEMKESC